MFDNTKPNIILLADNTDKTSMTKGLGVHKIAYLLRQGGYEVAVINHLSIFSLHELEILLRHLMSDKTLFVGVSNFNYQTMQVDPSNPGQVLYGSCDLHAILPHGVQYNDHIKKLIRDRNPRCKLVLGGASAADLPIFAIFDYVVLGYAEISVMNLANHLCHGETLNKTYRSVYGPMIINDAKADGYDFEQCHMQYADHDCVLRDEVLYFEVARGCIFNCTFCAFPMNGKNKFDYIRRPDLIRQELMDNYDRFGVTKYFFVDDTFNDSVEKCQMIYDVSRTLPFQLEYWAFIRLDLLTAHPETIDLLIQSGLRSFMCGIETFNARAAKAIRKGGDRERLIKTIDYIKNKWGDMVQIQASFLLGLPYEDMDSLNQTIDYLLSDRNNLDSWGVQALRIRHPDSMTGLTNGFISDFDRYYERYGYRCTGKTTDVRANAPLMLWENEFTSFTEMVELERRILKIRQRAGHASVFYYTPFEIAGLGVPLSEILNVPFADVNWYKINKLKLLRATHYKELLFQQFNLQPVTTDGLSWKQQLLKYKTWESYLYHRILTQGS